jgi:hypothetical protein
MVVHAYDPCTGETEAGGFIVHISTQSQIKTTGGRDKTKQKIIRCLTLNFGSKINF